MSPQTPVDTGEESIKLEAVALDPGGLDKVVILLNGKELPDEGGTRGVGGVKRAPSQAAASSAVTQLRVSRDIPLQVGDNKIEVIARDGAGASSKVEVLVRRTVQGGNVYALVVGINSYNDAQGIPALRYAEADATAVADFLKTDPKSPVKDPANVQVLLGAQATKKNIMKALETHILGKATYPRDMAIFYFAGHGFSKGQSYLLASVDTEYDSLLATGIKREDIQAIWGSIAAEQKLFVADACHSGGLKDVRGDNEINSGLSTLTQAKGSVTLLAAGEKQKSHESEKLKHGIFTHVLVEGMKGAADQVSGNRDGRVNVTELASYVKTTVPAMALQEHGAHQDPIVNFVGMDGELVISKPKSK